MTEYLDIQDALQVIDRYGFHGPDIGLLAAALARPATAVRGVEAYSGLALKAATVLESTTGFHPLVDGNKRTGWTLMVLTVWINGCRHDFSTNEAFDRDAPKERPVHVQGAFLGCGSVLGLFSRAGW